MKVNITFIIGNKAGYQVDPCPVLFAVGYIYNPPRPAHTTNEDIE